MNTFNIDKVEFGIYSPEEIKAFAVCKIDNPKPKGTGSLYDDRMGFKSDTNQPCVTCGLTKDCWGHFGYIELAEPVLHPMYYRYITYFLKCFCKNCYKLLLSEETLELFNISKVTGEKQFKKVINLFDKNETCLNCNQPQPKVIFKPKESTINLEYKQKKNQGNTKVTIQLTTEDIKKIFDNISDDDVAALGFDPKRIHPRNLIITVLPVIPPCSRPYVITDGNICDDDLTFQMTEIIKQNNKLLKTDITPADRLKYARQLQFRVMTTFNNSKNKAKHPTNGRPMKGIKERLTGKGGRIRGNLMGKRVDFSARTVIGADPNLKLGQVGIPKEVAQIHTKSEIVTSYNINKLTEIVNNGHANILKTMKVNPKKGPDPIEIRINLNYALKNNATKLQIGDCVERIEAGEKRFHKMRSVEDVELFKLQRNDIIHKRGDRFEITKENKKTFVLEIGDIITRKRKGKDASSVSPLDMRTFILSSLSEINSFKLKKGDIVQKKSTIVKPEVNKRKIELKIGDVVERQLIKNDLALFNRQPSLHRGSILGTEVVPMPYKTFRFNLAGTKIFNADFDGDEMNLHIPQNLNADTDTKFLAHTTLNIITPQESKPAISITQDTLVAVFLMTRYNDKIEKEDFFNICMKGEKWNGTDLWDEKRKKVIKQVLKENGKNGEIYNGRGMISLLLPDDFNYEKENGAHPNEPIVKIKRGVFLEGAIDKSIVGTAHGSIIQLLNKEYGIGITANFIDNIQFIGNTWLVLHGFSIGLEDCMITSKKSVETIKDTLTKCYVKAQGIEETTQNPGIREVRVTAALSQAKDIGMKIAKDAMKADNNFLVTVISGAKGDFFNIAQLTGLLGQQNLEGKRVTPQLNNGKRTLPHYPFNQIEKEREYESRGFVRHSFVRGLSPEEFFSHAMAGREGICDTSTKTPQTGYTQRRIVKVCEDIQVRYDRTVRDTSGRLYQFAYGENLFDTIKTVKVGGKPQFCDISRLVSKLNTNYELGIEGVDEEDIENEIEIEEMKEVKEIKGKGEERKSRKKKKEGEEELEIIEEAEEDSGEEDEEDVEKEEKDEEKEEDEEREEGEDEESDTENEEIDEEFLEEFFEDDFPEIEADMADLDDDYDE